MFARWAKILSATILTVVLLFSPAYGQKNKGQAPAPKAEPKPVVQYIVVVVLLAIPIGLICRSSRRQT
jgi:NaMN:DMB phosphoribosyltransferase